MMSGALRKYQQWPEALHSRTDPGLVELKHHALPDSLQPLITTIFTVRCDEQQISDILPAAVGYLAIIISGAGHLRFASGRVDPISPELLLAPTNAAAVMEVEGPMLFCAAALSPLGWAALTGIDATSHVDRADDATAVLGEGVGLLGAAMRRQSRAEPDNHQRLAEMLAQFIAARLRPVNPRHVAILRAVADWLSSGFDPALNELERTTGYSLRQLQRLLMRYFGAGPKLLARKYRALRVAALLQSPETSDDRVAELLNLFYDQSHLIRELRHFTGATPSRLAELDGTMVTTANALRNFTEIRPNVARMPGD